MDSLVFRMSLIVQEQGNGWRILAIFEIYFRYSGHQVVYMMQIFICIGDHTWNAM